MRTASLLLSALLLAGCPTAKDRDGKSPSRRARDAATEPPPVAEAPKPVPPAPPPVLGLHARWLVATSGGTPEAAFDGDPATGWRPEGDPVDESVSLRFETPVGVDRVSVRTCAADPPASFTVVVNGTDAGRVDVAAGSPGVLAIGAAGAEVRVSTFQLRVARARPGVCVAEVQLRSGESDLLVRPPRAVPGTVRASSVRLPAAAYHPFHLVDQRPLLPWVAGKVGSGVGESFTLQLQAPLVLVGLELWNGDQRAPTAYTAAPRAGVVGLSIDKGALLQFPLVDRRGSQRIDPPAWLTGDRFTVSVLKVIGPGSGTDLTMAEVRLWDPFGPVVLQTPDPADRKSALMNEVGRTPFAGVLDRRWEAVCPGSGPESLKLRGNHGLTVSGPGAAGPERFEGEWARVGDEGAWTTLRWIGLRRPVVATWQGPDQEVDHEGESFDVKLARVAELGRESFGAVVAAARSPGDRAAFACLATLEHDPGTDEFDALVAREAVVVRGPSGVDLLWLAPPPA